VFAAQIENTSLNRILLARMVVFLVPPECSIPLESGVKRLRSRISLDIHLAGAFVHAARSCGYGIEEKREIRRSLSSHQQFGQIGNRMEGEVPDVGIALDLRPWIESPERQHS
jgi:hypothetical protein